MSTLRSRIAKRLDETPMELTVAFVAIGSGFYRFFTDLPNLSAFTVMFWLTLIVGGPLFIAGRLREQVTAAALNVQSAGLALMVGGYLFVMMRQVGDATTALEMVFALFKYLAITLGLALVLRRTRRALKSLDVDW